MPKAEFDIGNGCDLDVSPARAFALISDPAELRRWFAEDIRIEPCVGGAFAFAGRGAYVATSTTFTQFEVERTLVWEWPLHGVTGHVALTVTAKESPESCRVDVMCNFPELPPIPRGRELIDDLWRFHIGNLKTLAKGGTGVILPDFSDPAPEVRETIHIDAPRAAVFKALIDPALLAAWTFGEATVDPRVGGRYSYGWVYEIDGKTVKGGPTRILEMEENVRLVTDWPDWRGDATNDGQRLTWLLEDNGGGTKLTVIHEGFGHASDITDFPFGWNGFLGLIEKAVMEASS